jgi:hypothetical protein
LDRTGNGAVKIKRKWHVQFDGRARSVDVASTSSAAECTRISFHHLFRVNDKRAFRDGRLFGELMKVCIDVPVAKRGTALESADLRISKV